MCSRRRSRARGFTLVEVLIAIVLLLIGVIFALRVFPAGFNAINESKMSTLALNLAQNDITSFEEHPESLPDAILPLDDASDEAIAAMSGFGFDDLRMVDFLAGEDRADLAWMLRHRQPISDRSARWPLWQPTSVRAMRRVVGERCVIPTQLETPTLCRRTGTSSTSPVTVDDDGQLAPGMAVYIDNGGAGANGTVTIDAVNAGVVAYTPAGFVIAAGARFTHVVAGAPAYVPRFAPVAAPWVYDAAAGRYTWPLDAAHEPVTVYDLRYQSVTKPDLEALQDRIDTLPGRLYYHADYQHGKLYFLPDDRARRVRFTFFCHNGAGIVQVVPRAYDLPALGSTIVFATTKAGVTLTAQVSEELGLYVLDLQDDWSLIAGSEQLNRAYIFAPGNRYAQLASGHYGVSPTAVAPEMPAIDVLYFSSADAGRTVKIDYTLLDWNILRQDVTVDDNGYITLAVPDPKLRNVMNFPREPDAWGLYGPMIDGTRNTVMGLVHLRTGMPYSMATENPSDTHARYVMLARTSTLISGIAAHVDAGSAKDGRLRIGGLPAGTAFRGAWTAGATYAADQVVYLDGRYFRALSDHTADTANQPLAGGALWAFVEPDWTALRGETYRVFYRAHRDWTVQVCRAPAQFWYMQMPNGVAIENLRDPANAVTLSLGWQVFSLGYANAGTEGWIALPGVYAGQTVAVDYQYREAPGDPNSPLLRVSGETHAVPTRVAGKPVSVFQLLHAPEPGTLVTVRGISVTVRALWAQPRAGRTQVYPTSGDPFERNMNERWQQRALTVVLPTVKQ